MEYGGDKMNLKLARIKMGLTQKQLAQLVGLSNVTISHIEKGNDDTVTKATMVKIAKVGKSCEKMIKKRGKVGN